MATHVANQTSGHSGISAYAEYSLCSAVVELDAYILGNASEK